ncbi:MAG: enoyl-CoA hydratase/isomerase family protein [Woeseia sp.]
MYLSTVEFEKRGPVAEIRLNRPEKLNAVNAAMVDELNSALDEAEADENVRVILLSGNGRAYSAGFDLEMGEADVEMSESEFMAQELKRAFHLIMRFWDCPIPTIAAVHGYCLGSSMEISAVCDITIATDECRFGAPEVRFGSGIVCLVLPWIVGVKNAKEILLVGSTDIDTARALEIGLINRIVPGSELMAAAHSLADEIALNDPLAVRLTKDAIRRSVEIAGMRQALTEALETDIEIETTETPESKAFNEILAQDGPKAALAWRAAKPPDTKIQE